jgi:molybdopterin-binding protein
LRPNFSSDGLRTDAFDLAHSPIAPPAPFMYRDRMALSARNQLRGQIKDLKLGSVMAHVVVQVGDNEIESVITRRSAEEMKLQIGDEVMVVIKSTEVMLQK